MCIKLRGCVTLSMLSSNKRLDKRVGGLGIEGQRMSQRGQFRTLLQEGLLQTVSSSVEVLLQWTANNQILDVYTPLLLKHGHLLLLLKKM